MTLPSIIYPKCICFTVIFLLNSIHQIYIYQIFITHSSIDEQLVWFQFFAIANKAAGISCSNALMDFSVWVGDKCIKMHSIVKMNLIV